MTNTKSQIEALAALALQDGHRIVELAEAIQYAKRVGMVIRGTSRTEAVIVPAGTYAVSDDHYSNGDIRIMSLGADVFFVAPAGTL